ncbi:MAG: protein kinase [Gimesia chilikensis]|uniref:protein kinase domain-containing protein n=1 Tax=Gimesia chilikensis TaxID=2605989 RepID=UPI00379D1830
MYEQNQLEELLVDWSLERQRGNHLSAEEIGKDHPELVPDLSSLISKLLEMDWLEEEQVEEAEDFLSRPDFNLAKNRIEEFYTSLTTLSLDDFFWQIIDSEVLSQEQVEQLRQQNKFDSASDFAAQLIEHKQLTPFQAGVLLEQREIPLVLDRYVLLDEIGKGGMGTVYRARHRQLDRIVALKILPREAVDSPDKVKRFQREAKAAAKLEHANIVTTYDASESKGYHFLVMSLVEGSDLSRLVHSRGPLTSGRAVDYITQAASGLAHAHRMGIIHRDIKPGNLLLSDAGQLKILDMGLARINNSDSESDKTVSRELTQSGMVMGTLAYLAPEQALDTRVADARSDIYSLGCTLFFLLTGRQIYFADTIMKTIVAHRESAIPKLSQSGAAVPEELETIFRKMVAKQPEDRFQSMDELIAALESLEITEEDIGTEPAVSTARRIHEMPTLVEQSQRGLEQSTDNSQQPPHHRRLLLAAGFFGLIVVLAGLLIILETPAGTVILDIDQPELLGATVMIDNEMKTTIQRKQGLQPIEIVPDEKRHQLKVKMDGFETFTREFTFETGNQQTIQVRLEPLQGETRQASSARSKPASQPTPGERAKPDSEQPLIKQSWGLQFDGIDDFVALKTLTEVDPPLTFECWVKPESMETKGHVIWTGKPTWETLEIHSGNWQFGVVQPGQRTTIVSSEKQIVPGVFCHVAATWDGRTARIFVNGREQTGDSDPVPGFNWPGRPETFLAKGPDSTSFFAGTLAQVRISDSLLYDKNFTPDPRFTAGKHTLALYYFDQGEGAVLRDASGHGHDGTIVGAEWVKVRPLDRIHIRR